MRMRRKKNLYEKLAFYEDKALIVCNVEELNYLEAVKTKEYFKYKEIFKNENPVQLEIGCGKGQFAVEIAKRNPNINFLAVEVNPNVLLMACQKWEKENLPNLKFVKCQAEHLLKYIPDKSIDRIYLNFSCPFPKKKYANHRLTAKRFLDIYKEILKDGAEIHQKTDNMHFFEFSIEQFSSSGFALKNVSLDLHSSSFEGNIMTEYEKRFTDLGQPIYRLEAFIF